MLMMKNPSHPGRLIKADLEALGVSVAEAAAMLGCSRQQLHRVIKGTSSISPEMAYRLAASIGSTVDFWLRVQMTYDMAQLRGMRITPKPRKIRDKAAA